MRLTHIFTALATTVAWIDAVTSALATDLVPHRAIYSMTLGSTTGSKGPASIRGVMSYEFQNRCNAWI